MAGSDITILHVQRCRHARCLNLVMQAKLERELRALQANMEMAVYRERTPEAIKAEDASKLARLHAQQEALHSALLSMEDMQKL